MLPDSVFRRSDLGCGVAFATEGHFRAQTQSTHKNGLNFSKSTLNDGRPIALEGVQARFT